MDIISIPPLEKFKQLLKSESPLKVIIHTFNIMELISTNNMAELRTLFGDLLHSRSSYLNIQFSAFIAELFYMLIMTESKSKISNLHNYVYNMDIESSMWC
jgi:hypothetical protein